MMWGRHMESGNGYYVGNAATDSVAGTAWFLGQFVPEELGLRHQTDVELKWGVHSQGDCRPDGLQANGVATTISVLVRGTMQITFAIDGNTRRITLRNEGDYVIFGPELVHGWEAITDSVILSIRFPSVDVRGSTATALTSRSPANSCRDQ
jgi:hypothetical protein